MKLKILAVIVFILTGFLSCTSKLEDNLITALDDSGIKLQFDSLSIFFISNLSASGSRKIKKYRIYNFSGDLKQEIGFRHDGKVFYIKNYKYFIEEGRRYTFYPSSILAGEFEFQDGKNSGRCREYDRNGFRVFKHSKIDKHDTFDLAIRRDE